MVSSWRGIVGWLSVWMGGARGGRCFFRGWICGWRGSFSFFGLLVGCGFNDIGDARVGCGVAVFRVRWSGVARLPRFLNEERRPRNSLALEQPRPFFRSS